jgi:asparagine synthase (glutamine-hydrolysing)
LDPLRAILWRSVRRTSLPALLRYEDRNSMAHSIEARLPFLTTELAQFALSLPPGHLVAPDATGKSVFRAAMRGLVPDVVLDRREKVGFPVPGRTWITLVPGVADLLAEALRIPAVDPAPFQQSLTALRAGHPMAAGTASLAWRLAILAAWIRRFDVTVD